MSFHLRKVAVGVLDFLELSVPPQIAVIGERLEKLSPNCKSAIRAYFWRRLMVFKADAAFEFWLRKGGELV